MCSIVLIDEVVAVALSRYALPASLTRRATATRLVRVCVQDETFYVFAPRIGC